MWRTFGFSVARISFCTVRRTSSAGEIAEFSEDRMNWAEATIARVPTANPQLHGLNLAIVEALNALSVPLDGGSETSVVRSMPPLELPIFVMSSTFWQAKGTPVEN